MALQIGEKDRTQRVQWVLTPVFLIVLETSDRSSLTLQVSPIFPKESINQAYGLDSTYSPLSPP